MTIGFPDFPKIPRLSRDCTITEKIDGTNASIHIRWNDFDPNAPFLSGVDSVVRVDDVPGRSMLIRAGSRTRWLEHSGAGDNFGFGQWVFQNAYELAKLGIGHHYGEWWGRGIQRGYGLNVRKFSLFNTHRWGEREALQEMRDNADVLFGMIEPMEIAPACCSVVPILYQGPFKTKTVDFAIDALRQVGSIASLGFMQPEGVVIFHHALNGYFKKTLDKDEEPKGKSK